MRDPDRPSWTWLILVFPLYAQILGFDLTFLDDNLFVRDLGRFLGSWSSFPALFTQGSFFGSGSDLYYRPLQMLSWMLDLSIGKGNLGVLHLSNIVFHFAASCLLLKVLLCAGFARRALPLALLFALHPALVQAVAWIPGRTDSLLAIFCLASFRCFQARVDGGGRLWLAAHWLLFAAALLTKELAIVLPAICIVYALLSRPQNAWQAAIAAPGWILLEAGWVLLRRLILKDASAYTLVSTVKSVWAGLPALLPYLGKAVIPVGLSPYPILKDAPLGPGLAALLLLAVLLWRARRNDLRLAAFGGAWFLAFILPTLVLPRTDFTPAHFEYRLYLPLIGLLIMAGELEPLRSFDPARRSHAGILLAVLAVFSAAAFVNARSYRNADAHWLRAVAVSPRSSFAHKQLGAIHLLASRYADAERESRLALVLYPREPLANNNLGVLAMSQSRYDEAAVRFQAELELNPGYGHSLYNLGLVREAQGKKDEAAALWRRLLALEPNYTQAYARLAAIEQGNPGVAVP